jgi:hypothetical protein
MSKEILGRTDQILSFDLTRPHAGDTQTRRAHKPIIFKIRKAG